MPPRIAAGDRRAVERRVEGLLVHLEPTTKGLAGAPSPGLSLLSLHNPRRLADDPRCLAEPPLEDRERLEWVARLDAGPAHAVVSLQRRERAVEAFPSRHPGSFAPCLPRRPSASTPPWRRRAAGKP